MEGLTIKETGFYEMLLEQRTILHSLAMQGGAFIFAFQ